MYLNGIFFINIVTLSTFRQVPALFMESLFKRRGISESTTSVTILTSMFTMTQGRVTLESVFSLFPSPNLKVLTPS